MKTSESSAQFAVRAGDREGLGVIYDSSGRLIPITAEAQLAVLTNWDLDVISPWRRVMPKTIFAGFHGKSSSSLYITSERLVLVRKIDDWREVSEQLTPLGLPNAAAREAELRWLREGGIRQFCEIFPSRLHRVSMKRYRRQQSMLDMRLLGDDGRKYGILLWKTDGKDEKAVDLIGSRFGR